MKLPHLVGVLCLASFATIVGFAQQGAPAAPGAPAAAATPPLPPPRGTLTIGSEADAAIKAGVQAPPGFIVTAFAAPPVVNYPTCVTATHDGVVFVCVDRNGSLQADPGMGYIVRLVDKDQNGQADEYSVFAALDSPRGAVFDGEALYVSHPPFVTALRDADGDGIAEDRRTLVRGLGFGLDFRGADHTTNGLEMGIDGWLYIAVGDYGAVKAVGADGQEIQMRGGGNVRVRPDGTDLEIYSRGTRNDYDLAIDPYLNLFARGNTNDGGGFDIRLYHFVAGANFGYPTLFRNFSDEVVPPLADYGTGSGTGMLFVHDAGLPAPYGNALYSVDWGRNAIFRHPLQPKGSTFAAQQEPFITVTRPNDITVDGSSRMYVASWAGGQFRYAGENVGYIARLTHEKATPVRPENLAAATDARLVEILASANLVQSRAAQSALVRRGVSAERLSLLERRATTATGPLHGRVAAIFTLKQMAGPAATATLVKMVADSTVRAFALRALADRRAELADVPKSLFVTALADKDPRVQLEAISGLKRLGATDAAAAMLPLTASADVVVSNVAINALAELAAIDAPLAALTQPSDPVAKGALRVLQQIHQPAVVTGLLARLPDVVTVERRALMLQALARLHYREGVWRGTLPEWWGTRPDTTGPYYDPVAWEESARIRAVLTNELMRSASGASSQVNPARFLTDLERNRLLPPGGAELLTALAADRHQLLGETARVLMGRVRLDVDAPTAQVFDRVARVNMRYRASVAKLVVAAGSPTPAAGALLLAAVGDVALPTDVRAAALTALASATGPDAARRAIDAFALVVAPTLEAPLETAWGQFIGSQTHATNVSTFRELTEAMDAAKQRLGYSVLLRLAADPPPAAVAGGARGGGGGGGGGGRGAGAPAAPGAGAAATATALPGAGAGAAPAAAPAAGRGAPAAAAAVAGGAPAGAAAGAARGGGAAGGRGGGGRGGRGGVSEAVLQTARSEARATIDRGWDSPSAANLVWAVGRTGAVQYRDRVEALSASPRADVLESVTYARARFAALTPATPPPTAAAAAGPVVSSIAFEELAGRLATVTGNAAAGRAIFERQACAACHTTAAGEPEKGPYLGGIFTRYSRAEVLESILRPAAKVAQGFATNSFTTTDNRQLTGFVIREGQDDVVIRDLTGAETTLRKSLISSRSVSEGSVMPPGLVDTITLQELASLLAFLESTAAK